MNMNRLALSAAALSMSLSLLAQQQEKPLLDIGGNIISLQEFEAVYNKNHNIGQTDISRQEYLELFTRYKLKVVEAKALGLDTTKSYKEECDFYYNELAEPYLTDTAAISAARNVIRERMKEEIDASHILVQLDPKATPADTLKAYQRISDALSRVRKGEDFNEVAAQCSDDPSAVKNKGRLRYFSALQMVAPFEDMAYATPVNQVSSIFRTQFGYHILKEHDRRAFAGEVMVSHIMKVVPRNATDEQRQQIKQTIDSLYQVVSQGADFMEVAARNSDDRQSARQGGIMPWFQESNVIPEFSKPAFALKNIGDVCAPIQTPFGYHIIKLIDKRSERPAETVNRMIDNAIRNGHRIGSAGKEAKGSQLIKEYNFQWNKELSSQFADIILTVENDSTKEAEIKALNGTLATYTGGTLEPEDIKLTDVHWNPILSKSENLHRYAGELMLKYEKTRLMQKYPEFRYTMQEYYDGLLVFEINQRVIWNDTTIDSLAIAKQYAAQPERYSKGGSFEGKIYFFDEPLTDKQIEKLRNGDKKLAKQAINVVEGRQEQGGIYDDIIWPLEASRYDIAVGTVTNGEVEPLAKMRGLIISDCQHFKENEWISELEKKYNPKQLTKLK